MDDAIQTQMMTLRANKSYFGRLLIGVILVIVVYAVMSVLVPYQREQRIARKIQSLGGMVQFENFGGNWIPASLQDRFPFFERIRVLRVGLEALEDDSLGLGSLTSLEELSLGDTFHNDVDLEFLKGLKNLKWLFLDDTNVTDIGVEHLSGLVNLKWLHLANTKITDAGLDHLKSLTQLKSVDVENTQVTTPGREMLRKALPNCRIYPEP